MKRHTTRDRWTDFVPTLSNREDFKTAGALWGSRARYAGGLGSRLPEEYGESARKAVFTVWSYQTPIAWENPDGTWTTPRVKYSATTSQHQFKIFTAVNRIEAMRTGEV